VPWAHLLRGLGSILRGSREERERLRMTGLVCRSSTRPSKSAPRSLRGELVEHRIHHAGLGLVDEGRWRCRRIRTRSPAPGMSVRFSSSQAPGAQHRAQDRFDALERPGRRQGLVDARVEGRRWASTTPATMSRKKRQLGRQILLAFDFAAEPMFSQTAPRISLRAGARHVHLVERLHGGEPRGAAPVGLAGGRPFSGARLIAACAGWPGPV